MGGANEKPYVLLYGSDGVLLSTRQWVLEASGFKVLVSSSGAEIEQILEAHLVAVLLLCHSLAPEACHHALTMAAILTPQTRRLLLDGKSTLAVQPFCHAVFDAAEGPAALVDIVQRLTVASTKRAAPVQILTQQIG